MGLTSCIRQEKRRKGTVVLNVPMFGDVTKVEMGVEDVTVP